MKNITIIIAVFSVLLVYKVFPQDTIVIQTGPSGKYANLWTIHPDNNYGHSPVFHTMGWTFFGEPGVIRSIMEFDLSEIPSSANILEAKLSLYYGSNQPTYVPHTGQNESYLRLITSEWNEETVTWNTTPQTTTEDQVYLPQSTEPEQSYTGLDVTIPIIKMFNEPENYHGLMLKLITEYPYASLMFASGNYDSTELRPKLEIIYDTCNIPLSGFYYITEELTVQFQDSSKFSNQYFWSFGDGYSSELREPWHTYDTSGYYTVCLETRNNCGSDTVCQNVFVEYSNITDPESSIFSIFPNPACDMIFIKPFVKGRSTISLLDLSGKEILSRNMDIRADEIVKISLEQVKPGIYIIKFDSGKNQSHGKLVVMK